MATSNVPSSASGVTENSPVQSWDAEQLRIQQSMKAKDAANISRAAAAAKAAEASFTNSAYGGMPPFQTNVHGSPALSDPNGAAGHTPAGKRKGRK